VSQIAVVSDEQGHVGKDIKMGIVSIVEFTSNTEALSDLSAKDSYSSNVLKEAIF
jgi:hypothetical protein